MQAASFLVNAQMLRSGSLGMSQWEIGNAAGR
jgi:hypothetical protein